MQIHLNLFRKPSGKPRDRHGSFFVHCMNTVHRTLMAKERFNEWQAVPIPNLNILPITVASTMIVSSWKNTNPSNLNQKIFTTWHKHLRSWTEADALKMCKKNYYTPQRNLLTECRFKTFFSLNPNLTLTADLWALRRAAILVSPTFQHLKR